jgi:hypothetical protein
MTQHLASWAVVATVDEPPALLQAFVAWHLSLGASQVNLYFDRPDDPAVDLFAQVAEVAVVRCDAAHWARLGKRRSDKHQNRQARNATDAYRNVETAWLLHCDADEFLRPTLPVGVSLEQVYPWIDCAVVPVLERVHVAGDAPADMFGGAFRRPFKGKADAGRDSFGPDYDLTLRGMTGHAIGKAFTRVGRDLDVSIHRARAGKVEVRTEPLPQVELLHFDGLTRLHWVYKLLRKADAYAHHNGMVPSPHRQRQIDAVLADPAAAFALHDRLKVAERDDVGRWELVTDVAFDPMAVITPRFGSGVDLTEGAFDAWLRLEKAWVFETFDLSL